MRGECSVMAQAGLSRLIHETHRTGIALNSTNEAENVRLKPSGDTKALRSEHHSAAFNNSCSASGRNSTGI